MQKPIDQRSNGLSKESVQCEKGLNDLLWVARKNAQ